MKVSIVFLFAFLFLTVQVQAGKNVSIPETELQKLAQHVDNLVKRDSVNEAIIKLLKDSLDGKGHTVAKAQTPKVSTVKITVKERGGITQDTSLFLFAIFAFAAGFVSIITPCVFPMVPMTVSFFTNTSSSKKESVRKAIIYGLSIVTIYTLIGVVIAKINGPEFANFLSTHWFPNVLFTLIFLVFALSFFGLFEITLPNNFINKVDKQSDKGGYVGIFFMAFTIVLVSFSCTGPIVSTILLSAAGGEIVKPIIGMVAYSSAFALPFTLFALFPNWLKSLPKSGGWLNTVKVSLGFIELALALKFLSIADQVMHWNILNRNTFLLIWILIFFSLGLYLLGVIKFSEHDKGSIGWPRRSLAILSILFAGYLGTGIAGSPLKKLSGYLPPLEDYTTATDRICGTPKYADFLHLPLGLQGYFDYKEALACAKQQGKPLFIDFTGHGCVNCREMERNVWADPAVLKHLNEDFVMVALYVDDRTELPENEWYTSKKDGKVKKSIGKQNHDFQNTRFNFLAQPFYVILDPNTEMELAQPITYEPSIEAYIDFLEEGKANYKKLYK
ncbi:protein-disulfide reductase DsbD family protein [Cytophaga hutchinsonii]|uniref:Thiol:disulfide interchange protein n=1 Tax=Cytophaga hutchinsonii (strain ATCC 33406 / DSM 1761 / CIP 103989 / NBRC 15051 / NCIMB 9469 / D465) TaxID=269798 RepID=A0A6N4SWM0_CYTH3|nr:cytochrome c biogenesis protein CcdA [Cytophaga hutchinsonii]ABG60708.1 thiol:disulfide interchange protein [Cytophaga hutchinsonii ATCC 33406]SFX70104.1 Thiol:disulfide interchange protein DsbD [Cytophaga hutchinsonii ATCC 33406]